jgi:hypothetical protein
LYQTRDLALFSVTKNAIPIKIRLKSVIAIIIGKFMLASM